MRAAGSSRACRSAVRRSLRSRSNSCGRKRRPHHHVGHQWQGVGQARNGYRCPHSRIIERAGRRQGGAEELNRVGEFERRASAGAFVEHRRGHARHAELPWRIGGAARANDHIELRHRHFVLLNDPDLEAVCQLLLLDRRQLQRRRRPRLAVASIDQAVAAAAGNRAARAEADQREPHGHVQDADSLLLR